MYLTDYHTHSCCSPDSTARLEDMVRAARRAGLRELCTTDHCDLQDENGAPLGGWDWTPILDQYWRARDKGGSEAQQQRQGRQHEFLVCGWHGIRSFEHVELRMNN